MQVQGGHPRRDSTPDIPITLLDMFTRPLHCLIVLHTETVNHRREDTGLLCTGVLEFVTTVSLELPTLQLDVTFHPIKNLASLSRYLNLGFGFNWSCSDETGQCVHDHDNSHGSTGISFFDSSPIVLRIEGEIGFDERPDAVSVDSVSSVRRF